jgi:hypothetical protein
MIHPFSREQLSFMVTMAAMFIALAATAGTASAQTEDIEPRTVGDRGATFVGLSGFVDRFSSSEEALPLNYIAQIDVCRFITNKFAIRIGAVGSGSLGGEHEDDLLTGSGAPSLHAAGGLLYYFTPRSMISMYVGAEYWAQLTQRGERDTGSVLGTTGLQAALSSRASFFIQGGVGARLARGDDDELVSRIVAQAGLRIKF